MNYLEFLILFVVIPLLINVLVYLLMRRYRQDKSDLLQINSNPKVQAGLLFLIASIAFIYTPLWDNFLVANNIWYYDQGKITGLVIWFVPVEEYVFFILQSLLIGVFLLNILNTTAIKSDKDSTIPMKWNYLVAAITGVIWFVSLFFYISGFAELEYFNLILLWSFIPVFIQLLFGFDILLTGIKQVAAVIVISTVYLSLVDAIAIEDGIWTITPATSTGILLAGVLPVEEMFFFLVTNTLIVLGLYLMLHEKSKERVRKLIGILIKTS